MKNTPRKICVVTGTRADYGLLSSLMRELDDDPSLSLQIVVTGAHLSPKFGKTIREVESDGFPITACVDIEIADDTQLSVARSTGLGVERFAKEFSTLLPDIIVILGDRYEVLAVATAALVLGIPLAHIHGGEITEGAMDDSIRHAVTKLSHLHFTVAEAYRDRVIQMGENPQNVFLTGALCLDSLSNMELLDYAALEASTGFDLGDAFFLVTYHPETRSDGDDLVAMEAMFSALSDYPEHRVLITGVNADPGGNALTALVEKTRQASPGRIFSVVSLGQRRYLSAMKHADAVVGNSSSGIIEAPALGTSTVNIGARQAGRVRAASVIDSQPTESGIRVALTQALSPAFKEQAKQKPYPFGKPGAGRFIKTVLKGANLSHITAKRFNDLPIPETGRREWSA